MNSSNASSLMPITPRPQAVIARGAGSYVWDEAGRRYLDFIQGWAVNCLGHCPPEVVQTLSTQANTLITPAPALHNRPQLELADRLVSLSGMHSAHFANSGAEANEAAIKLARKWGARYKRGAYGVISTDNAFHGRTLATMAASGKPGWDKLFPPYPDGFAKVPFGDLSAMAQAINQDTVALMVEPIQGEAGVVMPPAGYLQGLRDLADQHDLLLIFDEIQTGIGRTGYLFAFQKYGVIADILCLGKGLGGGVPISSVLAGERACCFSFGDQGGTYNGNPLMTAVALTVLNVVSQPHFLAQVLAAEVQLRDLLLHLSATYGLGEVRGAGLLYALCLPGGQAERVRDVAFDSGLIINAARPEVLRFMPSLRVSAAEIEQLGEMLTANLARAL